MIHYHAGWNLPGCLPEMEPATFDTEAEAEQFVFDEQQQWDEEDDIYNYWVEPCMEDDCAPGLT